MRHIAHKEIYVNTTTYATPMIVFLTHFNDTRDNQSLMFVSPREQPLALTITYAISMITSLKSINYTRDS
jgi:hypothetical protein